MIEHTIVDGRGATVAYLHRDWTMAASAADAEMVKVIFDDGDVMFLTPELVEDEWNEADHPRGQPENAGQFGPGGGGSSSTKSGKSGSTGFVSPNIHNLQIEQAAEAITSSVRQKLLNEASKDIHKALGLEVNQAPVVGAWSDGAENSIMLSWSGENPALERAALAMEGYIADQKSVLYFQPDNTASEFMARFTAEGDVVAVHEDLAARGLEHHTLRPTSEGVVVYVYGQDQDTLNKVGEAAHGHNAEMAWVAGKGEFIGTKLEEGEATDREQRDDARRAYEEEISVAAGGEAGHVWEELRDRWTRRLQQSQDQKVTDFNPNHDPETGEFTSGGGGGSSGSSVGGDEWNRSTATRLTAEFHSRREGVAATARSLGVKAPDRLDPLSERDDTATQHFAKALLSAHTAKVMSERLGRNVDPMEVHYLGEKLWGDWLTSSSIKAGGQLLQLAAAEELGGRFNSERMIGSNVQALRNKAEDMFAEDGGYPAVKAYVRGMWETTQHLLEQAGMDEVGVYRSIWQRPEARGREEEFAHGPQRWTRLPDTTIRRNGLASFSASSSMASSWGQNDRTVIRAMVPRTAIVSIPAYGENESDEMEVVVAGTAWRGWDAWMRSAPDFNNVPLVEPKQKTKDEAGAPAPAAPAPAAAPAENQSMQPVDDPDDHAIDLQNLDNDWLKPTGRARERLRDYNPNHEPAGSPEGGQFTSGEGGGGTGGTTAPKRAKEAPAHAPAAPTSRPARVSHAKPPLKGLATHRHPATISVRKPTAVKRTENPDTDYLAVNAAALRAEKSYNKNIDLLRNTSFYPMLRAAETAGKSSDEVAELFIAKAASNYRFMIDHATPEQLAAGGWYRNSKAMLVAATATRYGFDAAGAMGLTARMSPGAMWDLNVHFAERIMETASGGAGSTWNDAMATTATSLGKYPPEMVAHLAAARTYEALGNDFDAKAAWMRLVMESDRRPYNKINRDGTRGEIAKGPDGKTFLAPVSVSDENMALGIEMLESGGDREVISRNLGEGHKIRSFYNDLLDPEDGSEVVSDVHNAGGAVLMPVVPSHPVVAHMQGNAADASFRERGYTGSSSTSKVTGVEGLYGLYVDAVRRVAGELGMVPASVQAITWWAKKEMFGKSTAKKQREAEAIWAEYQGGELTFEQTQQKIFTHFTTRATTPKQEREVNAIWAQQKAEELTFEQAISAVEAHYAARPKRVREPEDDDD